jgi:hypothetical protein
MKSLFRGFVAVGIIAFAFGAARTGNQEAVTQTTLTQIPRPIPILKPDYTAEIRVTLDPNISSTKLIVTKTVSVRRFDRSRFPTWRVWLIA